MVEESIKEEVDEIVNHLKYFMSTGWTIDTIEFGETSLKVTINIPITENKEESETNVENEF